MKAPRGAALVGRNWALLDRSKAEYWRARPASDGIRIADELRRQILTQRPGWPSAADREEDLEIHMRIAEALRRVQASRRR